MYFGVPLMFLDSLGDPELGMVWVTEQETEYSGLKYIGELNT